MAANAMLWKRSTPRTLVPTLPLLLLILSSSALHLDLDDGDDSDVLEELLAIDDAEERSTASGGGAAAAEAEAMKRAQSIVIVLNNDNAKKAVAEHEQLLLLGYAPWCQRSADLMPRFAEAAVALRAAGSRAMFAKLDAERYPKAAAALGVKGFPTVLLFVNGTEFAYSGGHTRDEIVIWVRKKTGAPVIRLSSRDSAKEFLRNHNTFAIGLFKNYEGAEYEEFVKAATTDNEIQFVETNDRSIARVLFPDFATKDKFLGLVKSEPEKFEKFEGAFEEKAIQQFVEYNKFPLITVLTDMNSAKVYASPIKLQVFIFAEADDFEDLVSLLQEVAKKFKTKIMFVYVDTAEDNLAKPFLTLYGLEPVKPTVTAFDTSKGSKYLLEAAVTLNNLEEFCSGLLHDTLPPYFRSEPIPHENGLVEKVVGRTFDAAVLESPENVFLEVYADWCVDCEATSKHVEKLAKHFNDVDNLKFARIDASANEHPKLQVTNYPTLLFYPAKDKSNPIKLSKKFSVKGMIGFIEKKMEINDVEVVPNADPGKDEL